MVNDSKHIPTTHVGSLIRTPLLVNYLRALDSGVKVDKEGFDTVLYAAVADVIGRQVKIGIDHVSDGEYTKFDLWSHYVFGRLTGFTDADPEGKDFGKYIGKDAMTFPDFYGEYFAKQGFKSPGFPICVGPISYTGGETIRHDLAIIRKAMTATGATSAFVPLVAPASAVPRYEDRYYGSEEKFLFALAEALEKEYREVVDAGFTVQVDDAFLPYMFDMEYHNKDLSEYRRWCELRVAALNHALRGIPPERVRYHICWGSFNTPHISDVPLEAIVDIVLKVNAGAYCIEMGNPRHEHEWNIWDRVKLPEGKRLVPGVISHSTNVVEHPDLVAERLVRLARLVGPDNVMAGTDCGFAQGPFVQRVHPTIMWAKLQALVDGARIATKRIWS